MLWRHDGEHYPGTTCFIITPILGAFGLDVAATAAVPAFAGATAAADATLAVPAFAGAVAGGDLAAAAVPAAFEGAAAGGDATLGLTGTALDASTLAGTTPATTSAAGAAPISLNAGPTLATPATGTLGAGTSAAAGGVPGDIAAALPTTNNAISGTLPISTDLGSSALPTNISDIATGGANSFNALPGTQAFDQAASTIAPQSLGVTGGTAASGITPAATTSTFENLINDPSLSNLGAFAKANPSLLLGAAGLGYDILKGNQPLPNQGALSGQAAGLSAEGQALQQAELTGQLPAGAQAGVNQAVQANQAAIRSKFADLGLSGSTMETEALNSAAQQGTALGFQIAQQMAQQGLSDEQLSSSIYAQLTNYQLQQSEELSQAFANFAAAAGGGNTIRIVNG